MTRASDPAVLQTLFNQPPQTAMDFLADKKLLPSMDWHEVLGNAHNQSFAVAHLTRLDILDDIKHSLLEAQRLGIPMEKWRQDITPLLQKKGWYGKQTVVDHAGQPKTVQLGNPWRLETIYRTNLQSAYMAGRRAEMLQAIDTHPYWRYVAILDNRTRPTHRAMNGKVLAATDGAWDAIFPPCGFNCRCRVSPMTGGAVTRGGHTVESSAGHLTTEVVGVGRGQSADITVLKLPSMDTPFKVDVGFNHAPSVGAASKLIEKTGGDLATKYGAEWPVFKPHQITVDDFASLGKKRLDDVLSQVSEGQTLHAILEGAKTQYDYMLHHKTFTDHILSELQRTRQAGHLVPNAAGGAQAIKATRMAAQSYPASWVQSANNLGVLNVKYSKKDRGWCYTSTETKLIKLDKFGVVEAKAGEGWMLTDDTSTAVHEYAHRIQEARHDIDDLFQQEHRHRTADEAKTMLRVLTRNNAYRADELAKADGYYSPYMGKEYPHAVGREALEVMTMALQPILGRDLEAAGYLFQMYRKDRRMLELALGILFHCE